LRNSASQAVKCYSTALSALDRTQQPLQWVAGQIGLGNAHMAEAGRSSRRVRTEHLGEALAAYQEAASAAVQRILLGEAWQGVGTASRALAGDAIRRAETIEAGAQQADPNHPGANPPADAAALLEEARAAFDQSVDNFKQAHSPFQWATAHYELASVYKERALLESGPELAQEDRIDLLRKSVASYRLSSEVYTRATAPTDWAKIQGELGESLLRLGEKLPAVDPGTTIGKLNTLQEAVEALRSSLTTFRQFGMHDNWAAISDRLGAALEQEAKALPDGQKKHDTLSQAVEAFSSALHHYTCERAPLEWAAVQIRLARTYFWQARLAATGLGLGDASINVAALARQARECVERAIQEVYKPPYQSPFTSAHVQSSLRRSHVEAMEFLRDINALQGQG
jgi:tetratricopeptide (TPR) repeat protein